MGDYFRASLSGLDEKHKSVVDVRSAGLMLAMELDDMELAKAVTKQLLKQGIIINRTHENVLRFLPPYVIQKTHVDQLISALDAALHDNANSIKSEAPKKEKVTSTRRKAVHAHA
jgi:acetylornithine aminotransferase/acetylornithine/N-succinyldiaminopimelate aminotransferase